MKRIFIKPTLLVIDGETLVRKVRKPVGGHLAADGEEVNLDTYWQRRLNDKEVEVVPQATSSASPATTARVAK
ncbi:hypothetical protein APR50_17135 [Variovorax paradoxus]|jgi:Protein of unknown function (DUF2635)|uniref:DUF2635 domain-containing protein n=1 Tax=Variovorax paradoxus TaxID=34073 RepID=UPI0006E64920|nr:hypothetical protein APR52_32670 [Variovorax paradoxus]KPV06261.1 hypothetical protein APR50_17135 [Variovorax paradoxus]KPV06751.1 hypothetical protein APR49_19185 [Variovorax paradoxus]KPV20796.1 hypothetical protein APR51_15865 [Variovorax paradoxus]KPV32263.1 hypothetical protein APR48_14230 [Variovorax paradoxus]